MLFTLIVCFYPPKDCWLKMASKSVPSFGSSNYKIKKIVFHIPWFLRFIHLVKSTYHSKLHNLFRELWIMYFLSIYFECLLVWIQTYVILFIFARWSFYTNDLSSIRRYESMVHDILFCHHDGNRLPSFLSMQKFLHFLIRVRPKNIKNSSAQMVPGSEIDILH